MAFLRELSSAQPVGPAVMDKPISGDRPRSSTDSEIRLLISILGSRWDSSYLDRFVDAVSAADFDWDGLLRTAVREALPPLLYLSLRDQAWLPEEIRARLRHDYFRNARRNVLLFRQLEQVLDELAIAGIPTVTLKGAALAPYIYKNPAVRPMSDLDVLVQPQNVTEALGILRRIGYEDTRPEARPGDTLSYENETMLQKAGEPTVLLELHWNLFDSPYYQHNMSLDAYWETAIKVDFGSSPTLILGPEAQLLHLSGHLLLHHSGADQASLLWTFDLARVIEHYRQQLDWEKLSTWAQEQDLVLSLQSALSKVAQLWPEVLPEHVLPQIMALDPTAAERRVVAQMTADRRPVANRFWGDLNAMPDWASRWRYALHSLFPSISYMKQRYSVHFILVPFCYPYRWILGIGSWLASLSAANSGRKDN